MRILFTALAVPTVFLGLRHLARGSRFARVVFAILLLAMIAGFGAGLVQEVRERSAEVREWDFLGFWIYARIAAMGEDFYNPDLSASLAEPYSVSRSFQREIIDTGFWYPPPSMFLFLPLGWFRDPLTAMRVWYGVQLAFLALSALLLWLLFFPRGNAVEFLAGTALLVIAQGTLVTLYFAQTSFLALLLVLMFRRRPGGWMGGVWAVLALLAKPFLAVLALCLLLTRAWRALLAAAATAAVVTLGAWLTFGADAFGSYFRGRLVETKPAWIYDEPTNQSLLGLVLRVAKIDCTGMECMTNPIFMLVALSLAAVTLPLGFRLARRHEDLMFALFLLLALLLYPVSQSFYSVLVVPLLLLAYRRQAIVPGGAWTVAGLAGLVFVFCAIGGGAWTAVGYLVLWMGFALLAVRVLETRSEAPATQAA